MRHMTTAVWSAAGGVPNDVESDVHHGLANPVGQRREVDIGSDVAAPSTGAQRLQHRLLDGGGRLLKQFDKLPVCARRFIKRHLQSGAMFYRATCDRRSQFDDLVGDGPRVGLVQFLVGYLADAVEVRVIPPHQLNENRFLRFEVVVQGFRAKCPRRRQSPVAMSASLTRRSTRPLSAGFRCGECRRRMHLRGRPTGSGCFSAHLAPVASSENARSREPAPTNRHRASLGVRSPPRLRPRMVAEAPRHLHSSHQDPGRAVSCRYPGRFCEILDPIFGLTLPGC